MSHFILLQLCYHIVCQENGTFVDERLEYALKRTKARLVVLDPIQGFLGAKIDMNKANEVRPAMKHLMTIAEKYKCAVVLIGHIGKNGFGKAAVNQGLGSTDFSAAPRSVLFVGRLRSDPETRVICHTKSSLAPEGTASAFRLDKEKGFEWIGKVDVTPDELMLGTAKLSKKVTAAEFLRETLSEGMVAQTEIMEQALLAGISEKTIRKIPEEMCVKLLEKYQAEQKELSAEVAEIEESLNAAEQDERDVDEFISRLKKYVDVQELTREMCLELIEYITVDEYATDRPRDIHIYYKMLDEPLADKDRLDTSKITKSA